MFVIVVRATDTATLYLQPVDAGGWLVTRVLPSGMAMDCDLAAIVGCTVEAPAVLAWAAGRLPTRGLKSPDAVPPVPVE